MSHVLFDTSDMLNFLLMNTFWIEKSTGTTSATRDDGGRENILHTLHILYIFKIFCIFCIFCTFCISTGIETRDGG